MSFNSSTSNDVVKTKLDAVVYQEINKPFSPDKLSVSDELVFRQSNADNSAVITDSYGGVGYFENRQEEQDLAKASPRITNTKTTNIAAFAKSVNIPKHFFDDSKFDAVGKMMQDFGRLARVTKEKTSQGIFRNAFTTQLTNDGAAFISDTHTTISGATVDNKLTAVLSESSLNDAIVALMEQKTQDGTIAGYQPSVLVVPPALAKTAFVITEAVLRPGTANNDPNWYSAKYGIVVKVGQFMGTAGGGSDTAWFLIADSHNIYRFVRKELETILNPFNLTPNWEYVYAGEYREAYDTITYEGVVGSDGTVS